jgi:glutathione S-transferase
MTDSPTTSPRARTERGGSRVIIGQYDSPFVRRVAIAHQIYGIEYEHRPWGVVRDAERIARFNPLRRVPTVILPGGDVLVDSSLILDLLDEEVAEDVVLLPRSGEDRRRGLQICGFALGFAEKALAVLYERVFGSDASSRDDWLSRCEIQLRETAALLERTRGEAASDWLLGDRISHADIAMAVAWHFFSQANPDLCATLETPELRAHSARCEALEPFRRVHQPLDVPR